MEPDYAAFRRELDAVLAGRDPAALRAFMIARGEWPEDTTTDPARALWMMIATSPSLAGMRGEALAWLRAHGFAAEADTLSGKGGKG